MIFSSIPLFVIALFSKWMPESSRWLLAAGRVEEAQKVLQYVAKVNGGKVPNGNLKPVKVSGRGLSEYVMHFMNEVMIKIQKSTLLTYCSWLR